MVKEVLLACVGKPSAGKSSFLNSVTEATAKVGNYPFTTIKPNQGVAYMAIDCPCKKYGKESQCKPRHGTCENGIRHVPVHMLDVAGLVPGASEGQGLGNQFLDDLRHANALIHVVDVSGTTDASGKVTQGYDPINDIDWLRGEIHSWVLNNLLKKWPNIVRRHTATKSTSIETLQAQFSGYGSTISVVAKFMDKLGIKDPLETWDNAMVGKVVDGFLDERFPTVVALNKIDMADADKYITKIMRKFDPNTLVLTSALAEAFLRDMHKKRYINYQEGTDIVDTKDDLPNSDLKPLDDKLKARIEKVQDLVLYRYGSTGVHEVLKRAVEMLGVIPAYPVKSITNFSSGTGINKGGAFRDCILIWPGTTVREFARIVHPELDKYYLYAETVGGIKLAEDAIITEENNIISFKTSQNVSQTSSDNAPSAGSSDKKAANKK
ncbi:P-loop containing nucleoside triphosphate hydrolase protein [Umbelopsis sp. PMI_123]|nr:P-loop containing nucleoside triphosphate hydrolase protein [Umbelopsis sp. PMI_123]